MEHSMTSPRDAPRGAWPALNRPGWPRRPLPAANIERKLSPPYRLPSKVRNIVTERSARSSSSSRTLASRPLSRILERRTPSGHRDEEYKVEYRQAEAGDPAFQGEAAGLADRPGRIYSCSARPRAADLPMDAGGTCGKFGTTGPSVIFIDEHCSGTTR